MHVSAHPWHSQLKPSTSRSIKAYAGRANAELPRPLRICGECSTDIRWTLKEDAISADGKLARGAHASKLGSKCRRGTLHACVVPTWMQTHMGTSVRMDEHGQMWTCVLTCIAHCAWVCLGGHTLTLQHQLLQEPWPCVPTVLGDVLAALACLRISCPSSIPMQWRVLLAGAEIDESCKANNAPHWPTRVDLNSAWPSDAFQIPPMPQTGQTNPTKMPNTSWKSPNIIFTRLSVLKKWQT